MFENILNRLNENRFFIGMMVMFVTIGGRFIINELSEQQRALINNPNIKNVSFLSFVLSLQLQEHLNVLCTYNIIYINCNKNYLGRCYFSWIKYYCLHM